MAYRRSLAQYGKPALRWLAPAGDAASTSAGLEALQATRARATGSLGADVRSFTTSRLFQAQSTATADAGATFERVKSSPVGLYAGVGGALGAVGGIYWLLFGGSSSTAEIKADEAPLAQKGLSADHIGQYDVQTHTGSRFTSAELADNFAIVYFGATRAVDCVSELEKLGEIVQQSDRKSNMHYLAPLFVTIDSDHDNDEKMRNVVDLFNSSHNRKNTRLVGLTGPDTVKLHQAAVEYSGKGDNVHPEEPDNRFYLVNPEGEFVKAYPQSASTKEITDEMFEIIKSYSLNHATWHAPKKIARRHA